MLSISRDLLLSAEFVEESYLPIILWDNLFTRSTVTADQALSDYPVSNLANPNTSLLWKSGSTASQFLTIDLPGTTEVDAVGFAVHNFGTGVTEVTIEAMLSGGDWEVVFEAHTFSTDDPLLMQFIADYYIGVRIRLVPASVAPQAAVCYVGKVLTMERGVQPGHTPLPYARRREVVNGRGDSGSFLGRITIGESRAATADFRLMTPAWYRAYLDPFLRASPPFFFAWAPAAYPEEVGFAWFTNDPVAVPSHLAGYMDVTFDMEAIGTT